MPNISLLFCIDSKRTVYVILKQFSFIIFRILFSFLFGIAPKRNKKRLVGSNPLVIRHLFVIVLFGSGTQRWECFMFPFE